MGANVWTIRKAPNAYYDKEDRRRWRNSKRKCGNHGCILVRQHRVPGLHFIPGIGPATFPGR